MLDLSCKEKLFGLNIKIQKQPRSVKEIILSNYDPETRWPKEVYKRNLENVKNGTYFLYCPIENLKVTKILDMSNVSDNIVYMKINTYLSETTKKFCEKYCDKKYKDWTTRIVLFFTNYIHEREFSGWFTKYYERKYYRGLPSQEAYSFCELEEYRRKMFYTFCVNNKLIDFKNNIINCKTDKINFF